MMLNTAEFEARGPAMVDVVADFVSSAVFLLKSVIAEASVCNRVLSEFRLSPTVIATVALDEEVVFLSASMLSPGIALVKIFVFGILMMVHQLVGHIVMIGYILKLSVQLS